MLVFTAFYLPELPFIFYRCQQLGAHMKCYHFTVTNCHRFRYSPDVTCAWSPRNLCVKWSIYTTTRCLAPPFLPHSRKHSCSTVLYNNSSMRVILLNVLSSVLWCRHKWVHTTGQKHWVKHSFPQTQWFNHRLVSQALPKLFSQNPWPSLHVWQCLCRSLRLFIFQPLIAHLWKTLAK